MHWTLLKILFEVTWLAMRPLELKVNVDDKISFVLYLEKKISEFVNNKTIILFNLAEYPLIYKTRSTASSAKYQVTFRAISPPSIIPPPQKKIPLLWDVVLY